MRYPGRIVVILSACVLLSAGACGRKGPPSLPERTVALRILDLTGNAAQGTVTLTGRVTAPGGLPLDVDHITGCRVYHAHHALDDPPCEGVSRFLRVYGRDHGEDARLRPVRVHGFGDHLTGYPLLPGEPCGTERGAGTPVGRSPAVSGRLTRAGGRTGARAGGTRHTRRKTTGERVMQPFSVS